MCPGVRASTIHIFAVCLYIYIIFSELPCVKMSLLERGMEEEYEYGEHISYVFEVAVRKILIDDSTISEDTINHNDGGSNHDNELYSYQEELI